MNDRTTTMTVTSLLRERHTDVKAMFDQLLHSVGGERRELFDCLRAALAVHETAEEVVVHPKVRSFGDDAARAVDARLEEEKAAKQVLADLEQMDPDEPAFVLRLTSLRDDVLAHADAEEREIFPRLEQGCSAEEQMQMAERILTAERMAPTHPHPHGPSGRAGNLVVGPFAAMVDKVRDAMKS